MLPRPLQQNMRSIYVRGRELIRITEAEIDVRLSGKVEDGVYAMLAEHSLYFGRRGDVALLEREVCAPFKNARVIERRAVVELVE